MASKRQQLGTLIYWIPRPRIFDTVFLQMAAMSPRIDTRHWQGSEKRLAAAVKFYEELGVVTVKPLKSGARRYIMNYDRVKELALAKITEGIAAHDEHTLWALHSPSYGCYFMPLKRIFPQFRKVFANFWSIAYSEGTHYGAAP